MLVSAFKGTAIIRNAVNYVFISRRGVKSRRVCIFGSGTV